MIPRINRRPWAWLLLAAWGVAALISPMRDLLPASWWFEPGDLIVENSEQGRCPVLHFTRIIHRPFRGEWVVTLRRQLPTGSFAVHRVYPIMGPGHSDYSPDAALPDPLTFDWWANLEPEGCNWPVGVYQVLTAWTIQPGGRERFVRVTSNPFLVTHRPGIDDPLGLAP